MNLKLLWSFKHPTTICQPLDCASFPIFDNEKLWTLTQYRMMPVLSWVTASWTTCRLSFVLQHWFFRGHHDSQEVFYGGRVFKAGSWSRSWSDLHLIEARLLSQRMFESYQPMDIGLAGSTALSDEEVKDSREAHGWFWMEPRWPASSCSLTGGQEAALINLFSPVTAMGKRLLSFTLWILFNVILHQMKALLKKFPDLESVESECRGGQSEERKAPRQPSRFLWSREIQQEENMDMLHSWKVSNSARFWWSCWVPTPPIQNCCRKCPGWEWWPVSWPQCWWRSFSGRSLQGKSVWFNPYYPVFKSCYSIISWLNSVLCSKQWKFWVTTSLYSMRSIKLKWFLFLTQK